MKIFKSLSVLALALMFTSCLGDLNTLPLNESDFTSEKAYEDESNYLKALAYINGYYMLVGQKEEGSNDLGFSDAGQSEFLRQWWNMNEMSCDALKCVWGDSYIAGLQSNTWSDGENSALTAVYTRAVKAIALANEYLIQTESSKVEGRGQGHMLETIAGYRAEARFHKAMFLYVLMDEFGNPPFPTTSNILNATSPDQINRAELFEWLETELLDLASEDSAMPEFGEVPYPRPTKGAVWALLSRMYLNAEVYTGTARWQDAKDAAAEVIKMGYRIHDTYSDMFRMDNTTNGAVEEFVFAIAYDRETTRSWGGSTTYTSASLNGAANEALGKAFGFGKINGENWGGYHVPHDYVRFFELNGVEWGNAENLFGYDRETSDKRAFFTNFGNAEKFDISVLESGWFCWKWCGLTSEDKFDQAEDAPGNWKLSSADMPIFRLAELYLNYAEADARLNGGQVTDSKAKGYIKELRDRAGVSTPSEITLAWLLDERARELMWEGHRRVDLIRYGHYTSMNYPWPYKGGVTDGKVALDDYRIIYPLVATDVSANSNLVQNPGY